MAEKKNFMNIRTLTDRENISSQNRNGTDVPQPTPHTSETVKDSKTSGEPKSFLAKIWQAIINVLLRTPLISSRAEDAAPPDVKVKGMPLADRAKIYEARYGPFPRPITEQHLSSYAALRRLSAEVSKVVFFTIKAIICYGLWIALGYALNWCLHVAIPDRWGRAMTRVPAFFVVAWYLAGLFPVLIFALSDGAFELFKDYHAFFQRESFGTAKWQTPRALHMKTHWLFKYQSAYDPAGVVEKTVDKVMTLARWLSLRGLPTNPHKHGFFPVAPFGFGTWICYPLSSLARHLIIFGLPGSGKTASFIMSYVRNAGTLCSAVVMDIKGEIYRHCAHKFKRVFRFDLENAHLSDRLLLGRMLRRDYDFAQTIARSMIQYDPNKASSGNDKFFRANGMALLTALLLHLAETNPDFTPGEIFKFLEDHPVANTKENGLIPQLLASKNSHTREIIAGMPVRAAETFDGILSNMTEALQTFKSPHIIKIFSPPTKEEYENGYRAFDPFSLRQKGTGLFIVVPEDRAALLGNVVGTVINLTSGVLRRTAQPEECDKYLPQHALRVLPPAEIKTFAKNFREKLKKENAHLSAEAFAERFPPPAYIELLSKGIKDYYLEKTGYADAAANPSYCCFIVDEAANVQLLGLREDTGVGRGRKLPYLLVYHNTDQLEVQFGREYARTITETINTRIFLPGLEGETARYASGLLKRTTTFSRTVTDAKGDQFDSLRTQEMGRELMTEDEVRTLSEYNQALMVALTFDPMRISFPREQVKIDATVTEPQAHGRVIAPAALNEQSGQYLTEFVADAKFAEKMEGYTSARASLDLSLGTKSVTAEAVSANKRDRKINLTPAQPAASATVSSAPEQEAEGTMPETVADELASEADLWSLVMSDDPMSEKASAKDADETPLEVMKTAAQREAEENIEDDMKQHEAGGRKNQNDVAAPPQLGFSLSLWARQDSESDGAEREPTNTEAGDEEEYVRGQKKRFKQKKPTRMRM